MASVQRPSVKRLVGHRRVRVWMPYACGNRTWLRGICGPGTHVTHEGKGVFWIARPHLRAVIDALAAAHGAVEVTLQFSETERCDARCRNANPATWYDCVCSCLARHHGGLHTGPDWLQVGETALLQHQRRTERYLVGPAGKPH